MPLPFRLQFRPFEVRLHVKLCAHIGLPAEPVGSVVSAFHYPNRTSDFNLHGDPGHTSPPHFLNPHQIRTNEICCCWKVENCQQCNEISVITFIRLMDRTFLLQQDLIVFVVFLHVAVCCWGYGGVGQGWGGSVGGQFFLAEWPAT